MVGSFWTDKNAIKRKCKIMKEITRIQKVCEKLMEDNRKLLNSIEWTDETWETRTRLYKEYGKIMKIYSNQRITMKWCKDEFLKNNITG